MPLAARTDDDRPDRQTGEQSMRPMPEKSAAAFRTIKEAADELDVPQHVLRFWETRFAQVRPVKRAGGRRYYRPDDLDLLKGIQRLLHGQGYTIKGAQRVLRERGLRFVQSVGRGEAEAGAPSPDEVDRPDVAGPPLGGGAAMGEGSSADDRAVLEEVLRDLHACRAAIAQLRLPPEADPDT